MSGAKPNPVVRVLPSLTDVAFVLPAAFLFLVMQGARTMLGDGDTGWHVRTGEWILQNGRIPRADIFSYTMPGQPWFAWEWLWDLCFGWLHQRWGMAAVVAASLLVLCLTFALLFRLVRRKCGNDFLAIAVTALTAAGCSIHYLARPHLFSFLFIVVFYGILDRALEGRARGLWLLPVLMVLWTNLHGGFLAGLILTGAYAGGELATWLLDGDAERRPAALRRAGLYLATAAGCFAATFVNPYGYHLHQHIVEYLRDPQLWQTIQEFQPLTFQGPVGFFAEPMFVLALTAALWNVYRRRFVYSILVFGWGHGALMAARNLPIFVLVAAPAVAEMLEHLLYALQQAPVRGWVRQASARFTAIGEEFSLVDRIPRFHLASAVAAAMLVAAFYVPSSSFKLRAQYDPSRYPAKALSVLRAPESRRIFTHDEWGDYLIYNLYPLKKVFVDGRSDFYGASFGKKYQDVMGVKFDWEKDLSQYSVDTILLPVDESLAGALKQSPKWRVVYDDGMAIIFRSATPAPGQPLTVKEHQSNRVPSKDKRHPDITAARGSDQTRTQHPSTRS